LGVLMALPRHLLGGGERFLVGSSLRSRRDGVTGGSAANALAAAADAILLIGTRLSDFTTASRTLFRNLELIQLNIAAYVISTYECSQFRTEFAVDSPMERAGFELPVPARGVSVSSLEFHRIFRPYSSLGLRNQRFDSFSLPRKLGRTSTADACMRALTLPSIAALSGPC
jgi:hypothetical protein